MMQRRIRTLTSEKWNERADVTKELENIPRGGMRIRALFPLFLVTHPFRVVPFILLFSMTPFLICMFSGENIHSLNEIDPRTGSFSTHNNLFNILTNLVSGIAISCLLILLSRTKGVLLTISARTGKQNIVLLILALISISNVMIFVLTLHNGLSQDKHVHIHDFVNGVWLSFFAYLLLSSAFFIVLYVMQAKRGAWRKTFQTKDLLLLEPIILITFSMGIVSRFGTALFYRFLVLNPIEISIYLVLILYFGNHPGAGRREKAFSIIFACGAFLINLLIYVCIILTHLHDLHSSVLILTLLLLMSGVVAMRLVNVRADFFRKARPLSNGEEKNINIFEVGTRIVTPEGVYEIDVLMNQGGFGQVYSASLEGSSVALKVSWGEEAGERLDREVKISTFLSKETLNILPMRILNVQAILSPYGLGGDVALPIDTEELHVGQMRNLSDVAQTLFSYIDNTEKSIEKSVFILRQTASCIARIHGNDAIGYLHGDISANNIFWAEELNTVIPIDFGNALAIENGMYAEIRRRDFVYNVCFMPPELRRAVERGEKYIRLRPSADVYSLGVLLYALLFEMPTETILEHLYILSKSKVQKLEDAGACDKDVLSLLDHFFENSLAEDAQHRYGSVSKMVNALDEILEKMKGAAHCSKPT